MKASTLILIVVGAAAVTTSSFAQTLPNRAKEMSIFDDHIGKWTGTMKWVAPGLEGDRMVTINKEWDGLFLKSTSSMDMPDHKVTQTSMTGWDPNKGEYQRYTFTNTSGIPRVERMKPGTEGIAVWVCDPWDVGGVSPMVSRTTVTTVNKETINLLLEAKEGDKWVRIGNADLKRTP